MKGSGRFGSDAKQRLAARQVSLKREKNKASRERAFSSPPSRTVNDVVNPISVEGASSIAGAYASRGLQKGIKSSIGQGLLGPIVGRIANYLIPENNKPIKDMTTQERKAEAYNALELPPIVGDAASIARVMEDINREGISPRTLARGGVDIGLSILNPVGGAATIKNVAKGIVNDVEINSASAKMLDEIDKLLGVVDEPTKAGVTKATKTTGFKLPDPDPTTGRIEPFDIGSDEIVTNTDFQAASLGIHHGQKTDDKVASAAMDELNASLGKNLKENKEGYRVYMDPVIPEGSSLARVIRQRFNVLDKDGRERFIQARVKDGYSEKDAANLWKGLGSKTDEELENWWTSFRQNNPEIPWDIQTIPLRLPQFFL